MAPRLIQTTPAMLLAQPKGSNRWHLNTLLSKLSPPAFLPSLWPRHPLRQPKRRLMYPAMMRSSVSRRCFCWAPPFTTVVTMTALKHHARSPSHPAPIGGFFPPIALRRCYAPQRGSGSDLWRSMSEFQLPSGAPSSERVPHNSARSKWSTASRVWGAMSAPQRVPRKPALRPKRSDGAVGSALSRQEGCKPPSCLFAFFACRICASGSNRSQVGQVC